jgi:L-ascorbate metabolism protein UlaG (beta-lactamase superfamily)
MIDNIQWLGYGSFRIQGPPLIYIHPWRVVRSTFHAEVILIGNEHYASCSTADVRKLTGPETKILGNEAVKEEIPDCEILRPWQSITIENASIKGIPAYSTKRMQYPKEAGGLGFVISVNLYDIYYAGNTEITPEMDLIRPDIAILPIAGDGMLDIEGAVEVVKKMRPRWVIPSHWGDVGESATHISAQEFKKAVGGRADVVIPTPMR